MGQLSRGIRKKGSKFSNIRNDIFLGYRGKSELCPARAPLCKKLAQDNSVQSATPARSLFPKSAL
jgi:hypothetical protein